MSIKNHNRKKKKNKISAKYMLFILTLVCLGTIFTSLTIGLSGGPLQSAAGYLFVPMQKGLNLAGKTVSDRLFSYHSMEELRKENEELKEKLAEVSSELALMQLEQFDIEEYRRLLKLSEFYADKEHIGATVISRDTTDWFSFFAVDKGSRDGIEVGMNVLAQEGLVGYVTKVGPNYAIVRSIIDDSSNTSAMDLITKNTMNISGGLEAMESTRTLAFSQLRDADDQVNVGDPVVTSYISDRYHAEIMIGYISTLEKDPNNLTKSGTIAPVVDFEHLQDVLIITEQKPILQEDETEE